jgi:Family of unknown function (DUF6134)
MKLAPRFSVVLFLSNLSIRRTIRLLLMLVCLSAPVWCFAAEPEVVERHTREFRVFVDGKPRGVQTMTISRHNDKSEVMQGEVDVQLNFVVYKYRYSSTGTETWKDGRLVRLTNEANYNGDKYSVEALAVEQALHYEVNGEKQKAPADILVASYWREPDAKRVGRQVRLLDSDKGRQMAATMERVGPVAIKVDATEVPTTRYRIRGDVDVDVWYDRSGFIVRQESVESGHKTLLELTKIRRQ